MKIRHLPTLQEVDELVNFMVGILNIKVSTPNEAEQLDTQMALAVDLIKSKFGSLTIEEVKEAFKMYVARQFDIKVFRLLDCVSIGEILNAYIDFRAEALRIYNDKKIKAIEVVCELSESEKEQIVINGTNRVYNEYKAEKTLPENVVYIFDFLIEKGLLKGANTDKLIQFYEQENKNSRIQLIREYKANKPNEEIKLREHKEALEQIKAGHSMKIIIRTKRNVLRTYFDKQIEIGAENIFKV